MGCLLMPWASDVMDPSCCSCATPLHLRDDTRFCGMASQPRPVLLQNIAVGAAAQWLLKPALGLLLASTVIPAMQLPQSVATGLILVSH